MEQVADLLAKLAAVADRYREVDQRVGDPDVLSQPAVLREWMQERSRLEPVVEHYKKMKALWSDWQLAQEWSAGEDAELRRMAREDAEAARIGALGEELYRVGVGLVV